jgi:hypothetical protein
MTTMPLKYRHYIADKSFSGMSLKVCKMSVFFTCRQESVVPTTNGLTGIAEAHNYYNVAHATSSHCDAVALVVSSKQHSSPKTNEASYSFPYYNTGPPFRS